MSTQNPNGSPGIIDFGQAVENAEKSPHYTTADIACNSCRKTKLRCSKDRPVCVYCRKSGFECMYETKRIKPGLKTGAIESLHRRLDTLESQTREQAEHCKSAHSGAITKSQDSAASEILGVLARELPRLVGSSSETTLPRYTSAEYAGRSWKRRRSQYDTDTGWWFDPECTSPSLDPAFLDDTITAYFLHVHPWIPMIHEGRFRRRLEENNGRLLLVSVIQAMVVAASRFVFDPSAAHDIATQARRSVVVSAMDCLCLESLQALVIIAYSDIGDGNAAKAWSIIGSLTRTIEYSQLAQESGDDEHQPLCQPFEVLNSTSDWTEIEERRRIFWNVFNLDRFCSVTMGWNTSLTSVDVHRRLPCDGHLWRKEQSVATPYFGIWDKSAGRIGYPIGFLVEDDGHLSQSGTNSRTDANVTQKSVPADMSNVGAFAYRIEATESMSRVVTHFLQQKINIRDQREISSWLTRFKELDLRLVHWKMLLPQKWKSNPNMTRAVPLMDPNLTLAHVTHNASMILLHQLIAYPPVHWPFRSRLPSSCSIEACYSAGIEIATITQEYLRKSPHGSPIASQFAFCVFIAARVLLAHWRYSTNHGLSNEFWSLMQGLEEMEKRWSGFSNASSRDKNLSGKYAARLKELYIHCAKDDEFRIRVADYTIEVTHQIKASYKNIPPRQSESPGNPSINASAQASKAHDTLWPAAQAGTPSAVQDFPLISTDFPHVNNLSPLDFDTLPQMMLDQDFVNMDRIIAFDDGSMFASTTDPGMF